MGARTTDELEELRARLSAVTAERDALARHAASLDLLVAALPPILVRFDAALRITFVNHYAPGYRAEGVLGRPVEELIDPPSRERAVAAIRHTLATGEPSEYQLSSTSPAGRRSDYHTIVVRLGDDASAGGCIATTDITTVTQREKAVAESEAMLELALDASRVGLFSWDLRTDVVTWGGRMRQITGLDEPVTLPQYLERLVHPDDRERVASQGPQPDQGYRFASTHRIIRPDGEVRWVHTTGRAQLGPDGAPERIVGGSFDITEQRQLEEQLRQAQRVNVVGTLTAGIAHNFNNMLMVVLPGLELLRGVVPASHTEVLGDAIAAAERAADLVKQLMTWAGRRAPPVRRPSAVGPVATHVVAMCARTFDPHVALSCVVDEGLPAVSADPSDLEQVLMNLLLNARDAVLAARRSQPRIEVRVGREPATGAKGGRVFVRVTDNGVGMSPETLARACEPFFTTRPLGEGTGLGLATSSAIARELGGALTFTSHLGEGTTATLSLPESEARPEQAPVAASTEPGAATRTPLRVLLVDDEPRVRATTAAVLELHGHRVRGAGDGAGALTEAANHAFDVVLLDRSLPSGPGTALVARLRELAPAARLYFYTGHAVDAEEAALVDGVIQKPVRLEALLQVIEGA